MHSLRLNPMEIKSRTSNDFFKDCTIQKFTEYTSRRLTWQMNINTKNKQQNTSMLDKFEKANRIPAILEEGFR